MRNGRYPWFLLTVLIGTTLISAAQTLPDMPFQANQWKSTMKRIPSTGIRMGSLYVRFEQTALDDVRRAASVGDLAHQGDAGKSTYWLCYTVVGNSDAERIWLISDGEMGGSRHNVTGVSATRLPGGVATVDCPALPDNLKPFSLDSDLWLGASKEIATSKLGRSSFQKDAWQSYDFEGKVPGDCKGGGYDLLVRLLLHFQHDRADQLHVRQVKSC